MIARLLSATAALGLLAGPVAIACSTSGTRNPSFASSPSGLEAPRALAPAIGSAAASSTDSLSGVVTDAAVATRAGPLRFCAQTAAASGILGPVATVTTRKMTINQTSSKAEGVLESTTVDTYDAQGREVSTVTTDGAGVVTSQGASIYQGDLITGQTLKQTFTDIGATGANNAWVHKTLEYRYDAAGNLTAVTTTTTRYDEADARVSVERYHATPNGYISRTFEANGAATRTTLTLQDEQGREVRSEYSTNTTDVTSATTFDGPFATSRVINQSSNRDSIRIEETYNGGRVVKVTLVSGLPPNATHWVTFTRYSDFDAFKNPQLAIDGVETIQTGQQI